MGLGTSIDLQEIVSLLSVLLGIVLVARLLLLQLGGLYTIFGSFLTIETLGSLYYLLARKSDTLTSAVDYRLVWIVYRSLACVLVTATIYALLDAILKNYPGILRLSRQVLLVSWALSVVIGITLFASSAKQLPEQSGSVIAHVLLLGILIDRAVNTIVVLALLLTLCFLLWFPVRLPRNLILFSFGFITYFVCKAALLLFQSWLSEAEINNYNIATSLLSASCFALWSVFLSRSGNFRETKVPLPWDAGHQDRLLLQLESLNRTLMPSSRSFQQHGD